MYYFKFLFYQKSTVSIWIQCLYYVIELLNVLLIVNTELF